MPSTTSCTRSRRSCGPAATVAQSLREAARIELGLRAFLSDGGFMAFTDTFEDLGGLRQLPGIGAQRLMADGYGFGGEGDWKSSALVRLVKAMADGLPGGIVVHGGLHLRLRLARPDAGCPYAGDLPQHRGRAAAC